MTLKRPTSNSDSHSGIFHSYGHITVISYGLQILNFAGQSWTLTGGISFNGHPEVP